MDCSPPGSSVHGILQARLLEWVAMPSFRGPSRPRDRTCVFCVSCIAGRFFTLEPQRKPFQWLFTGFIFSNVSILTFQCLYIVDISPVNSIVLMVIFFHFKLWFFFFSFNWWVTTCYFWMFLSLQNLYFEFLMPNVMVLDDRGFGKWLGCGGGAHPQRHTGSQASSPN